MLARRLALIAALASVPAVAGAIEGHTWLGPQIVAIAGFDPNDPSSVASGVSGDGTVVVGSATYDGGSGWARAFRWSWAGMQAIHPPGTVDSRAIGVSHDGKVVVGWSRAHRHALIKGFRSIDGRRGKKLSGRGATEAVDVSDDGSIVVGSFWVPNPHRIGSVFWKRSGRSILFEDVDGGPVAVSGDGSIAVGQLETDEGTVLAMRWTEPEGLVSLGTFGGEHGAATAISADGSTIVGRTWREGRSDAVRWTQAEGVVPLGDLASSLPYVKPLAVSAQGELIVGVASPGASGSESRAVIWTAERGLEELATYLTERWGLDVDGWELRDATGVSDDGRVIVGSGYAPGSQTRQAWIAAWY